MAPAFQPIPERHDEYDSVFLRACVKEQHKVTHLQLAENTTAYVNPWLVPWHLRPKCDATELTISDFSEALRQRLYRVIEEELRAHPSKICDARELQQADRLTQYISHTVVQHGAALHTHKTSREECLTMTRRDLVHIFKRGEYVAETPSNPHWERGQPMQLTDDTVVRVGQRKPTTVEKRIAQYLAGPDVNIRGPQGRIGDLLERAQPHLLSVDDGRCIRYALDLRRRLNTLLAGKECFSAEDQSQAIDWIAETWHASLPTRAKEQLRAHVADWDKSIRELIEQHFAPEIISTREGFESRRFLLEQCTIERALETHGADEAGIRQDLELLFGVWWDAMTRHKLALCDYPTLGLSFLAGNARYSSAPEFVRHLGNIQ